MRHTTAGNSSFDELYGETIRKAGISAVPAALSRFQGQLGLTFAEVGVLLALFSYKWSVEAPFPSIRTLEHDSGVPRSSIHDLLERIAAKGYLIIEHRFTADGFKTSNAYHLEPLLHRLIELIEASAEADSVASERGRRRSGARSPRRPVSGRPDIVAGHGPASVAGHGPASVAGPDRPEVDSVETDSMEVESESTARNCADDANPPPEPQPPEPPLLGPTCHQLAYRLARAARRPGWHKSLAGELADYVTLHNLTPAQLERLVRLTEGPQPPRTEEELWLRLDPYRLAYVQPKAQPACLVGAKPLPISAIVPASPPTAAVGSSLEIGRRA